MPKFFQNPLGTVVEGVKDFGRSLGFGPKGSGSFSASEGESGPLAKLIKQTEMAQAGKVPSAKKGGKVKSASARADGCCKKGKTKGRIV